MNNTLKLMIPLVAFFFLAAGTLAHADERSKPKCVPDKDSCQGDIELAAALCQNPQDHMDQNQRNLAASVAAEDATLAGLGANDPTAGTHLAKRQSMNGQLLTTFVNDCGKHIENCQCDCGKSPDAAKCGGPNNEARNKMMVDVFLSQKTSGQAAKVAPASSDKL